MNLRPDGGYNVTPPPSPAVAGALDLNAKVAVAEHNLASGTGTLGDQSTVMNGSAANLVAAAGTGFKLDPEAGAALIASCDESLKVLSGIDFDVLNARNAPQLGGTKTAVSVADFTQRAASDPQGIAEAIQNLKGTISQMRQAYQKAVANYQAIEQHVTDSVTQLDREVQQQNSPVQQHGRNRAV